MKNLAMREKLRNMIPDIQWAKAGVTRARIKKLYQYNMPESLVGDVESGRIGTAEAVQKWEANKPHNSGKFNRDLEHILAINPAAKDVQDWDEYLADMKFCFYAHGFLPYEFICYELHKQTPQARKAYIPDQERIEKVYRMNDIVAVNLFHDKARTYEAFGEYYHRECVSVEKESDYSRFKAFVEKHPVFVKKQVFESIGNSVELVDITQKDPKAFFNTLIQAGKHILEEKIVQSPTLSALNASSVNTVRCMTFRTNHGVKIPLCFLKAGRSGSFVDNGGAGGIFIGLDAASGVVTTTGVDEVGRRYEKHPDTGIAFVGFQLPDWEQLLQVCSEMAQKPKNIGFVGWDLAHTEKYGWVVVEGNGGSQFVGPQTTSKQGVRRVVEAMMEDMTLIRL